MPNKDRKIRISSSKREANCCEIKVAASIRDVIKLKISDHILGPSLHGSVG